MHCKSFNKLTLTATNESEKSEFIELNDLFRQVVKDSEGNEIESFDSFKTIWNASEVIVDTATDSKLRIYFDTMKQFDVQTALKLSERFPTLLFEYRAIEDNGLYDVRLKFMNGHLIHVSDFIVLDEDEEGAFTKLIEVERPNESYSNDNIVLDVKETIKW